MSDYKGFISWDKYQELHNLLSQIVEVDGLRNKFDHLYSPDTDMADIICEDFNKIKEYTILDICTTINSLLNLATQISKLRRD